MEGKGNKNQYSCCTIVISSLLFVGVVFYKSIYYPISITQKSNILIYQGIYVNGYEIGGLSREEAYVYLNEKLNKENMDKKIKLCYGNEYNEVKYKDLGVLYDVKKIVEEAFCIGKKSSGLIYRTLERVKTKLNFASLHTNPYCSEKELDDYLKKISQKLNVVPKNAEVVFYNNEIKVINEMVGRKVDEEELKFYIRNAVLYDKSEIGIPFQIIWPERTKDMFSGNYTKLSSFSTPLLSRNINRTNNIKIAAFNINGDILYPGEVFSANRAIGKRTAEKGYKDAPIFQGGKVVPGLAGGICQLVTTIYNTALNANMQIIERRRHGQPVNYVAPGMDATIAGDAIDLKFRNTCDCPIYVQAYVDANKVNVHFYKINMTLDYNNSKSYYFKMNKYLLRKTMGNSVFEIY